MVILLEAKLHNNLKTRSTETKPYLKRKNKLCGPGSGAERRRNVADKSP